MTDRELMQQALEALDWHLENGAWGADIEGVTAALRERLAQPEQEPVAWTTGIYAGHCVIRAADPASILPVGIALYTAPPRREWVGLTEAKIRQIELTIQGNTRQPFDIQAFARAIEAAHGIKGEA